MNVKVNNWAVKLESHNIKFECIAGTRNVLAHMLSRLIEMDENVKQPEEEPGYEFGYTPFEELPPAKVAVIICETHSQRCTNQATFIRLQNEGTLRTRSTHQQTQKHWTGNTSQWSRRS